MQAVATIRKETQTLDTDINPDGTADTSGGALTDEYTYSLSHAHGSSCRVCGFGDHGTEDGLGHDMGEGGPSGQNGGILDAVGGADATGIHSVRDITVYAPTGDAMVDGLLMGKQYAVDPDGTTYTVTFSFPTSGSSYSSSSYGSGSEPYSNLQGMSEASQEFFRATFALLETYTNLDFIEVSDSGTSAGTIRPAWTSDYMGSALAWGYYPWNSQSAGDLWFSSNYMSEDMYDYETILLHELGHTLGLSHSFSGYYGDQGYFTYLPSQYDGWDYTVMAYDVSARYGSATTADLSPQTFMKFDILALQYLYGTNFNATAGDDTYVFDLSERYYMTIWDAGGTDTIGITGGDTAVKLNLSTDGAWLNVGTTVTYSNRYSSWAETDTVYLLEGSVIENAYGAGGNDTISGNNADNLLEGNGGDDILRGGDGNDTLTGGAGNDTLRFDAGWGTDTVTDYNDDADHILLAVRDLTFDDLIITQQGSDVLVSDGNGNSFILENATASDLDASDFSNLFDGFVLNGTAASETLTGDEGDDTLNGLDGHDTLYGLDGNDSLDGGSGNDRVYGATGDDIAVGGDGQDMLFGGDNHDLLEGGANNDYLFGENGEDTLLGGDGYDYLEGGAGNDLLEGGTDRDTLYGDYGDDTLLGGEGYDYLETGEGNDFAQGGNGDDSIDGYGGDDLLEGGAGHDRILGYDGDDTLDGGENNDSLSGSGGNDSIIGGDGDDTLDAGYGQDTLEGGAGNDRLYSYHDSNTSTIANYLSGGDGNDTLEAGGGYDTLDGGSGDDYINVGRTVGTIVVRAGAGNDTLYLPAYDTSTSNYDIDMGTGADEVQVRSSSVDVVDLGADSDGDGVLSAYGYLNSFDGDTYLNFGDYDYLAFGRYTHTSAFFQANEVDGNTVLSLATTGQVEAAQVTLGGTGHNLELIDAGVGFRIVDMGDTRSASNTSGGTDFYGNSNHESLTGGSGNDALFGQGGNDTLAGGDGRDSMYGGDGDDLILSDAGNESVHGGAGDDTLSLATATRGVDVYIYNADTSNSNYQEFEHVIGTSCDDSIVIYSTNVDNYIEGGAGNDELSGRSGDDTLNGGAGNDLLGFWTAESGKDLFVFEAGWGNDTVADFGTVADYNEIDYLDLRATGLSADDLTITAQDDGVLIADDSGNSILLRDLNEDDIPDIRIITTQSHTGGAGADTLIGSFYDDTFSGGGAADVFEVGPVWGNDTISDFCADEDRIDLRNSGIGYFDLTIAQSGSNTVISDGNGNSITLTGVTASDVTLGNFIADDYAARIVGLSAPHSPIPLSGERPETSLTAQTVSGAETLSSAAHYDTGSGTTAITVSSNASLTIEGEVWAGDEGGSVVAVRAEGSSTLAHNGYIVAASGSGTATGIQDLSGSALNLSGDIVVASTGAAVGVQTIGTADTPKIINQGGDVSVWSNASATGIGVGDYVLHIDITNTGTIEAIGTTGVSGIAVTSQYADITNNGTILASGTYGAYGIRLDNPHDSVIINNGTITGNVGVGGNTSYGEVEIINRGTITASGISVWLEGYEDFTLNNSGTLNGQVRLDSYGTYSASFTNTGTVNGSVRFGSGDDFFDTSRGTVNGTIDAGYGDDSVIGSAADDIIHAGSGHDTISGGAGDDTIHGNWGNDRLTGGTGADIFHADNGDIITDFNVSEDIIGLENYAASTVRWYQSGADTIVSYGNNTGSFRLLNVNATTLTDANFSYREGYIRGTYSADQINGTPSRDIIYAYDGNDLVRGHAGNDNIQGGNGNDTIYGGNHNDYITGGNHNDLLFGEAGDDSLFGNDGNDSLSGGLGSDWLSGGDGYDRVDYRDSASGVSLDLVSGLHGGGAAGDRLFGIEEVVGSNHNDTLQAGDDGVVVFAVGGNDHLIGGAGVDYFYGGDGNDTLQGGLGADELRGEGGHDRVDYRDSSVSVSVNLATGVNTGGTAAGDRLFSIEEVVGSQQSDTIVSSDSGLIVFAVGGNDNLKGGAGVDRFYGGDGNDTLQGGLGADNLVGEAGYDRVDYRDSSSGVTVNLATGINTGGSAAGDTLSGIEEIVGSTHGDTITTNSGGIVVFAVGGNDHLIGGSGDDHFYGGSGNDTLQGGMGADNLVGEAGYDRVDYRDSSSGVSVNLATGVNTGGTAGGDRISGVEELVGSQHGDTIVSSESGIVVFAVGGNDYLKGGAGVDRFYGGNGNDTLQGGMGADVLAGEAGYDRVDYRDSASGVSVNFASGVNTGGTAEGDRLSGIEEVVGSQHNDTIAASGEGIVVFAVDGDDHLTAGAGIDRFYGGNGTDTVDYSASTGAVLIDLGSGRGQQGYASGDQFSSIERAIGSNHNDTLIGSVAAETLIGGAGHDRLDFRGSSAGVSLDFVNDVHSGGTAEGDSLSGFEEVVGSYQGDTIVASDDGLVVFALDGDDHMTGGAGIDRFYGGQGTDTISYANSGSGVLINLGTGYGQHGDAAGDLFQSFEIAVGSDHNDTLIGSSAADTLIGGAGYDRVDYRGSASGVSLNFATGTHSGGTAEGDSLSSFEEVVGSQLGDTITASDSGLTVFAVGGDDSLTGGTNTDRFYGGSGNDALSGEAGNDQLVGEAGNDTLDGGDGNDTLSGGDGDDDIYGGSGDDIIRTGAGGGSVYGGDGADQLISESSSYQEFFAGEGNDTVQAGANGLYLGEGGDDRIIGSGGSAQLSGGDGNDSITATESETLAGGDGNDTLIGGTGGNTISGEAGNDLLDGGDGNDNLQGGDGNDTLAGGAGADTLDGGNGYDIVDYSTEGSAVEISSSFTSAITSDGVDSLLNIEEVIGSAFDDSLRGDVGNITLSGGDGNDTLKGGRDNTFNGGAGDDSLHVYGGNNDLDGGDGNDYLFVEPETFFDPEPDTINGFNTLSGGAGNDTLLGGNNNDTLDGGSGDDSLSGGSGNDSLTGGGGQDSLYGGTGDDILAVASGTHSLLDGGSGNDTLSGSSGDELLTGGSGNDSLTGGGGLDTLSGGAGDDTISGSTPIVDEFNVTSIWGGDGNDLLTGSTVNITGGSGNDTMGGTSSNRYFFEDGHGHDVIMAGDLGDESIRLGSLSGLADLSDLAAEETTQDDVAGVLLTTGSGSSIFVQGVTIAELAPALVISPDSATNDSFAGTIGADSFVFDSHHGNDVVTGFNTDEDTLDLTGTGITDLSELMATDTSLDGVSGVLLYTGRSSTIFVADVTAAEILSTVTLT